MKKILLILLSCLVMDGFAQDHFQKEYRKILQEVDEHSHAYNNLEKATSSIGHRLTGSSQGKAAEEFAYGLLKSYGYEVRYQPFRMVSWARKSLQLAIGDRPLKAVALAHSPVRAQMDEPILDVGNGLQQDYQGKDVKGKIALVYLQILPGSPVGTKNLHRSEKTAIAAGLGAKGVIFINAVKGGVLLTGTASITGDLIDIPAVCIGYEDGMELKERLARQEHLRAKIDMENTSANMEARNVVATLEGKSPDKIVVGGHLDSWDLATGAIDNGIGSFAVIDMAKTLKSLHIKPKRTIEFVLFMGEEQGLLGSKAYVEAAKSADNIHRIKFMLNYDMTNAPTAFHSSREEMQNLFRTWLGQLAALDSAFNGNVTIGAGLHSDHQPFMLEGVPYGGGAGGILPNNAGAYYHSDNDTFALVDKKGLEQTVKLGAVLAYSLAQTAQIPAGLLQGQQLRDYLERNGLKEPLQVSREWRW